MDQILLPNRYGDRNYLIDEGSRFKFFQDGSATHMRIIYENDSDIRAIDPPGGPMLSVGCEYAGKQIKSITLDNGFYYLNY